MSESASGVPEPGDRTEHQRTAEALRTSEARFRLFVTATNDSIYRMSADWRQMYSLASRNVLADTREPTATWLDFYIPDSEKAFVQAAIDDAIRGKTPFELEHRVIQADGTVGWTFSRAIPFLDGQGEIVEWFGAASDITERKQAETLLEQRVEERTRALADEGAALAAFTQFTEAVGGESDVPTLIRRAFHLLAELLAVDATYFEREGERYVIRHWPAGFSPALLARSQQGFTLDYPDIVQAARTRQVVFVDHYNDPLRGVAESALYGALAYQPLFQGEEMQAVLVMGTRQRAEWSARDQGVFRAVGRSLALALERSQVTRQLADQARDLAHSNAGLKASNEELEAFNYSVSHDLMTPVRHVAGFADLAGRHLADEVKARRYLSLVDQGAKRMETLIEAMLQLSRTGRQELQLDVVDLSLLVEQAQLDVLPQVADHDVDWRIGRLPLVQGDRATLQQVMTNLIGNAVKYSRDRDLAVIEVWAEEDAQQWTVSVRDNGVGFDPRYTSKLFGIFQRLHRQDEFAGTGVGLSLVRRIIARHGGTVSAKGEINQGATFCFILPRPTA